MRAAALACLLAASGCTTNVYQLADGAPDASVAEDAEHDTRLGATLPDAGADSVAPADTAADAVDSAADVVLDAFDDAAGDVPADAVDAPPTQQQMCEAYSYKLGRPRPYTEWEADGSCRTLYADGSWLTCEFLVASDGSTRCLPTPVARVLGWTNPTCATPEIGLTGISSGFTLATVFEAKAGAYVVRETSVANVPTLWYHIDASGVCAPTTAPFPGGGQVAATTARVVDPTTFFPYPHP